MSYLEIHELSEEEIVNPKCNGRGEGMLTEIGSEVGVVFEIIVKGGFCIDAPTAVNDVFIPGADTG